MSNIRKHQPEKISADCPHCGFSQLESAFAKSTICKRCSQHFSIEKLLAKEVGSLKPPSMFERLSKMISREGVREVTCFSCEAKHEVSTAAESSTCPKCGSYVDLRDFRVSGPFGRTVQTQGRVTILPNGEVTTRILCNSARIEGKMRGQLVCTGTAEIKLQGKVPGKVEAAHLVVERKCDVEFQLPLKVKTIEINGKIAAAVHCEGRVTIQKHGILTGEVHAKAIVVERGGIFSGELHIGDPADAPQVVVVEEAVAEVPLEVPPGPVEADLPTEAPAPVEAVEPTALEKAKRARVTRGRRVASRR